MIIKNITRVLLFAAAVIRLSAQIEVISGGNVGIGTTAPSTKLELKGANVGGRGLLYVNGDDHGFIITNSPTAGVTGIAFAKNGTTIWSTGIAASDASYYIAEGASIGSNQRLAIAAGGNVGIGTATPAYKLEVAGSVKATSFISSTTTYADFVFKPDYRLPSLAETEAVIQRDGHLPGIPSEAEAKEHGIDLSAMQVKLLQKVEELTLHVIAQEKRLAAQQMEIRALRSQLQGNPQ